MTTALSTRCLLDPRWVLDAPKFGSQGAHFCISGVERERRGEDRAADRLVASGAVGGAEVFPEAAALLVLIVRRERRVGRRGRVGCHREERSLRSGHKIAKVKKKFGVKKRLRKVTYCLNFVVHYDIRCLYSCANLTVRSTVCQASSRCLYHLSLRLQPNTQFTVSSQKTGDIFLQHFSK